MLLLFISFMVAFISNQRKKLKYHLDMQAVQEAQQQALKEQNILLEHRVSERTAELMQQKETLQSTLSELKASQLQLVQKEKMASLGELTAGIAHEIQNPLNFVNNFTDINTELIAEIKERLAEETLAESLTSYINPIIEDLANNLDKVLLHGKRADSIVKNMLQHSQLQTGILEPTDLNALADEYLKLSFYGFRSKHKTFNCKIETAFDKSIEPIHIIPQDIGRILVNLYNNAFYAMNEKKNNLDGKKDGNIYEPVLIISTHSKGNVVALTIKDNGIGIPGKFIDKIFQPFFTTKPTGGSTGLGLSLSYDIIKAHQGKIEVKSKEGEFAEFCIELNH
jgi:signal transduction histidine kinase